MPRGWNLRRFALAALGALGMLAAPALADDDGFTIAVIPDTQNYLDHTHQKAEGFPFDASVQFLEQMRFVAANLESAGGDIAFVTSVGDVWQHQTKPVDPAHAARASDGCRTPRSSAWSIPPTKCRRSRCPRRWRATA